MSRTKKINFNIAPFEGYTEDTSKNRLHASIYASMINSKAWQNLGKDARCLYLHMKLQYYGQKRIPDHPKTDIYFNRAMYSQTYKLYSNDKTFRKDRQELIDNGFIEYVFNGKNLREKSIYRLSDKWKDIQ